MLSPIRQAMQRDKKMLPPTARGASPGPRHITTSAATMPPQARPSNAAVAISRRSVRQYHSLDSRPFSRPLDGQRHRLHADALAQTRHQREEEHKYQAARKRGFVELPEEGGDRPAAEGRQQPRKSKAESAEGGDFPHLRKVKTNGIEYRVILGPHVRFIVCQGKLVCQQSSLHDAANPAFRIDDRKRQVLVEDEHFAGIQNRGRVRYGDDVRQHDLGQHRLEGAGEQPLGGQDPDQPVRGIHDVEVDDAIGDSAFANIQERLPDREVLAQQCKARVSAGHDGLAKVLAVGRHWTCVSDFTTAPHGHESSGAGGGCKADFKKGPPSPKRPWRDKSSNALWPLIKAGSDGPKTGMRLRREIATHWLAIQAGICYLVTQF